jgi:predicted outer membrane protein
MRHAKRLAAPAVLLLATSVALGQQSAPKTTATAAINKDHAQQLTDYYANVLMLANRGEIELAKIALERSTNDEVKQMAQKLIDDHSQLNETLQKISPAAAATVARADTTGEQRRTGARDTAGHDLLTELCRINHKAADNHLKQSKELLNRYKGQDFDMAFLGMMIGGHTWLASELDALNDVGTGQLKQVVDAAGKHVRDHLEAATALSKKLEDDRRVVDPSEKSS